MKKLSKEQKMIELHVVAKEVAIVKELNEDNKRDIFLRLLAARCESPLFMQGGDSSCYIKWLADNVYDNKLQYPSSGCLRVALEDFDNLWPVLIGDDCTDEEMNELEEMYKSIVK